MTLYENVSVHEYTSGPKEGERFLKFGKGDPSGSDLQLPTPNNDVEMMAQMDRERVLVWSLPDSMTKAETKEFLEGEKPEPVFSALQTEVDA